MGEKDYQFDKINREILICIQDLLSVSNSIEEFIAEGTQPQLDAIAEHAESVDTDWENTKKHLVKLIDIITGKEETVWPETMGEDFMI
jgi:hypothetical protein